MDEITLICTILVQLAGGDLADATIKYETLSCGRADIIDLSLPYEEDSEHDPYTMECDIDSGKCYGPEGDEISPEPPTGEPEPGTDDFGLGEGSNLWQPSWWSCETAECMDPAYQLAEKMRRLW